jgi:sulfofructose kinase
MIAGIITQELEELGVDCRYARRCEGTRTSLSSVMVNEQGERLIVNYTDPGLPAGPDWLTQIDFNAFDAVLADSRWPEGSRWALEKARSMDLPAILDADLPLQRLDPLVGVASHAAFSEPALREYSQSTDPEDGITLAQRTAGNWCCVTLGERGVCSHDGQHLHRQAAFAVTAKNTLGAGDVWHGAFALALAEGETAAGAVRAASAAAALKVRSDAGRKGIPTRAERDRFLESAR